MTMTSDVSVFYDCEASCIGGLPIELGSAFIDTSAGEIQSESHLVKPPLHWDMQPVWDPAARDFFGAAPCARASTERGFSGPRTFLGWPGR